MMINTAFSWDQFIKEEQEKPYFQALLLHLEQQANKGITIYPPTHERFNAFKFTPYSSVKVVIIGQDPYHGPNQAHGLCFSVKAGHPLPPSLRNIFKTLEYDLSIPPTLEGDLTSWATQGVLLLNTALTVEAHHAGSHANIGWQTFTDQAIQYLNYHPAPILFLLWGNHAQKKSHLIVNPHHHVLTAPHPSPLSAHRGFYTCRHFSQTNAWLKAHSRTPIKWHLGG